MPGFYLQRLFLFGPMRQSEANNSASVAFHFQDAMEGAYPLTTRSKYTTATVTLKLPAPWDHTEPHLVRFGNELDDSEKLPTCSKINTPEWHSQPNESP